MDDGAALLGDVSDGECKGAPACECGLAKDPGGCLARCDKLGERFGYDDSYGYDLYFQYMEECENRCYDAYEFCVSSK